MTLHDDNIPRILVIDDYTDYCDTIADRLRDIPAHVDVAYDGDGAVELITRSEVLLRPYRILIVDQQVPRQSEGEIDESFGFNFIRELRNRSLVSPTTFILVYTKFPNLEAGLESLKAGADDFILKNDSVGRDNLESLFNRCVELLNVLT